MKTLSKEQVLRLHNALLETFGGTAGIIETEGGRIRSCRILKESDLITP